MRMRSGNPILKEGTFARAYASPGEAMTVQGTVNRTLALLFLVLAGAFTIWSRAYAEPGAPAVGIGMLVGGLGGFVMALVTIFKRTWAPYTAPIYALLQGVFLGAISASFEARYPGIAVQAVGLTFGACFVMLALYKTGVLQATPAFRRGVMIATGAVALLYLVSIVASHFGSPFSFMHDASPLGIGLSLVIVGVAAFNLVLDFDLIETGARHGAPKYMEWFGAFALMVTLIWLYMEMLRLLARLQRR